MSEEMDFPNNPAVGDRYTNSIGVVYQWDGVAWGVADGSSGTFTQLGDLLGQIRTLLQDTDLGSGQYRYSTESIVTNINQGMIEMFRLRPDIFLANDYKIQQFAIGHADEEIVIEMQYVPALVYYTVGLTQARDDEETQDARASAFIGNFKAMLMTLT